jgi:hypothetical protein
MADLKVTVDADRVLARFSPAGIPMQVRNNLRRVIPDLMRGLTARIDSNLGALKSRTHLQLKGGPQGQMVENASQIVGRAEMTWTGNPKASMVPKVLESGSKPHVIEAVNAKALAFFWPAMGGMVFFKKVMHPGFPGIHYMENAFNSMRSEIVDKIGTAVKTGLQQ